ncbi:NAD(P)/FAD-dependent oxidoreductase [Persicitalea jodogahamensis]|uniref:FAD-dependent dehydrogenase n=1 Tax=Persicitalea jodogahamensis TaxID=402147 RepID=A0A8J3DA50_9BACT|nr:FAD-dependent oxidoreductase [Persicitalea jodogahamensis]GHB81252.1 FAD-dependent dehydrogenase [Persicitalea jodogahamensis]
MEDKSFKEFVLSDLRISGREDVTVRKTRQSIDARGQQIKVNVQVDVFVNEAPDNFIDYKLPTTDVSHQPAVIIVGSGPAGTFAALRLIELGIKPILLERGKDVRARRRDLAAINKQHIVNPDSNYCFGEGGAGTYSDGKLYTRSNKRGNIRRILEIFVAHGASEDILVEAHPHIGTNKLPKIVAEMRSTILRAGGEIHFDCRVTDLLLKKQEIKGVTTASGQEFAGEGVILATGHSARDIFELLHRRDILIEEKPFAMGVRIEHPQRVIDRIQYRCRSDRGPYLPAASYNLVAQTYFEGVQRGVFSFCMCPGGFIVPAATAPGELVVNGMSPSRRDSRFANSGIVVAVQPEDTKKYASYGPLAGLQLQRVVEQAACRLAGNGQAAPGQLVSDFVAGKLSGELRETSYQPGLVSMDMREVLPSHIADPLRDGLRQFGQKMRGYLTHEAQLIGIESRTSSPVRIPRDSKSCEHPTVKRLFPCGEGAGYAGGIMSAAMDGERCAEQLVLHYGRK